MFLDIGRDRTGNVWVNGVRYHLFTMARYPHRLLSLTATNDPGAGTIIPTLTDVLGAEAQLSARRAS